MNRKTMNDKLDAEFAKLDADQDAKDAGNHITMLKKLDAMGCLELGFPKDNTLLQHAGFGAWLAWTVSFFV
jgi:hypothetical protein